MLDRTEKRFGMKPDWLAADTENGSSANLGWFAKQCGIIPFIPVIDHSGRKEGAWTQFDFERDESNNQSICPEDQARKQFRRSYSDPNQGENARGRRRYHTLKSNCQGSPSKELCCPNVATRSISREEHEDAREFAWESRQTKAYKVSRDMRKKVEMLFANLKRILNLTASGCEGPNGAKDALLLATIAQDLREFARLQPHCDPSEAAA